MTYLKKNDLCLKNDYLFSLFLENKDNKILYEKSKYNVDYLEKLEIKFKNFFNYFVLLKLIKTGLKYKALHFKMNIDCYQSELMVTDILFDRIQGNDKDRESYIDTSFEIDSILSYLTKKQKYVIIKTILEDKKEIDVANELGVSQQAISKIKQNGLKKLKKILIDERWFTE